ncbi:MAG: hypothetical protein M3Q75_08875, partial [Gemmatimonadota bacterium]|nr:hypothetical protein [Gemmatimonadota bacterium]
MSNIGPLFEESLAALALVNGAGHAPKRESGALVPGLGGRLGGGRSTAMSIPFAPEPEPTAHVIELSEGQTTEPLPLGFEFEFFGIRYAWFKISSVGFMRFSDPSSLRGSGSLAGDRLKPASDDLTSFIALGGRDVYRAGRKRVAYEVRGGPERRRLVLSLTPFPGAGGIGGPPRASQLVLYERTGMVDVHTTRGDASAYRVAARLTTSPG